MRIISFDGGGIRGAFSARLIERIEKERPGFVAKTTLFAGTSVGGFLALLLAKGIEPSTIVDLFVNRGQEIFADRGWLDRVSSVDELFQADFDNQALYKELHALLGDTTLAELQSKVLVPAFDLDNQDEESKKTATRVYKARFWKPKFMHNFEGPGCDGDLKAIDVAMRSSAAPTYFPSYQGYVDGGLVDNNPAMSALAKAVKMGGATGMSEEHKELLSQVATFIGKHQSDPGAKEIMQGLLKLLANQVALLSVGTGLNPHYVSGKEHDWGFKQWLEGKKLLNLLFDGMIDVPHYQCTQLLNGRYRRVNVLLDDPIDLADIDRVNDLIQIADGVDLDTLLEWVDRVWWEGDAA